jgi:hypothetical protein
MSGERGVAIVEFALAAPLLVALALGVLEFGVAWGDANAMERAVQQAGRVGSNAGDTRYADYELLRAIDSSLAGADRLEIRRVIVYRSTSADGGMPAPCRNLNPVGYGAFGSAGRCNAYSKEQVEADSPAGFPFSDTSPCPGGSWDANWCPLDRDNTRPTSDYLGVYVEATYTGLTGLVPAASSVERRAVFLLEPPSAGEG